MSTATATVTDASIFEEILLDGQAELTADIARWILSLRFTPRQQDRMQELAELGNERTLTAAEQSEVEKYRRIATMLTTLHSRARRALQVSLKTA